MSELTVESNVPPSDVEPSVSEDVSEKRRILGSLSEGARLLMEAVVSTTDEENFVRILDWFLAAEKAIRDKVPVSDPTIAKADKRILQERYTKISKMRLDMELLRIRQTSEQEAVAASKVLSAPRSPERIEADGKNDWFNATREMAEKRFAAATEHLRKGFNGALVGVEAVKHWSYGSVNLVCVTSFDYIDPTSSVGRSATQRLVTQHVKLNGGAVETLRNGWPSSSSSSDPNVDRVGHYSQGDRLHLWVFGGKPGTSKFIRVTHLVKPGDEVVKDQCYRVDFKEAGQVALHSFNDLADYGYALALWKTSTGAQEVTLQAAGQ